MGQVENAKEQKDVTQERTTESKEVSAQTGHDDSSARFDLAYLGRPLS